MKKIVLSNLLALAFTLGAVTPPASADAPLATITGTVVSIHGEDLVVSTEKGNVTFDIDKNTEKPANLAVGNRITVSYDSDDKLTDKTDARRIVMAPVTTTPSPTPAPQAAPEPVTPAPVQEQPKAELPQTASPFPLLAALGVFALACAFLIRRRTPQA